MHKSKLKHYLSSQGIFSDGEIEQFLELVDYKVIAKGDFFVQEGNVCEKFAFVISGIFRSYYYSSEEEEITYCFSFPDSFLTAYSSFISGTKSVENIRAVTNTELFLVHKNKIEQLIKENKSWLFFAKKIAEEHYIFLENRIFQLQKEKAEKRYVNLLKEHPNYLNEIPLQYLASYLGITQRHLSRIRRSHKN